MKKAFVYVFMALLCGVVFGVTMYKKNEEKLTEVFNETKNISLFQVGYFSNYDNAYTLSQVTNGIIIPSENKYRVIVSILNEDENIKKCMKYLDDNEIYYYVKKITTSNKIFIDYLKEIEILYKNTNDYEVLKELNYKIIYKYKELEI